MQVIVDDIATHYTRCGKGKAVVILHGWGDDGRSWQHFAEKLSQQYEVFVPDLPGFGATEQPALAWDLTDYAQFVRGFIQKLGIQPYAVLGHSNGGAIAIRGVGQGLFDTNKLALFASAGVRNLRPNPGLTALAKVGKAVATPLPSSIKRRLRKSLYQKAGSDLLAVEHMQESFKKIVRDDIQSDAVHISIPVLLVYGENDRATPAHIGRELQHAIQGAQLELVPGAGHFLQVDAETLLLDLTERFLND